jgi:hypothetical protein
MRISKVLEAAKVTLKSKAATLCLVAAIITLSS